MKIIFLTFVFIIIVLSASSQDILRTGKYYYKTSLDTCNIASSALIGTSNISWDVKLKKIKVYKLTQDSIYVSVRYSVLLGGEDKLFVIDCFIVDENYCIKSSLIPEIKRKKYKLNVGLKKTQKIVFCLDGGEILAVDTRSFP